MKENIVYNESDNHVMVRTNGDLIYVICNKEEQQNAVIKKMTTDTCILDSYEEWDDDSDMKWILTFRILDKYEKYPDLN
jgi:hypothetical protein